MPKTDLPLPLSGRPAAAVSVRGLPRGSHAIGRDAVHEAQRARIFFGLAESLAQKGYGATAVADVLRFARVSRKSFYELFKDKEDCFLRLYQLTHQRLVEAVLSAQHPGMDWMQRLRSSHHAYLQFFVSNPRLTYAVLLEVYAAGPQALARREHYHAQFVAFQRNLYERRRREEPGLPELPDEAFVVLIAGINEVVAQWMRSGRAARLTELEPLLIYLVTAVHGGARERGGFAFTPPSS